MSNIVETFAIILTIIISTSIIVWFINKNKLLCILLGYRNELLQFVFAFFFTKFKYIKY